MATIVLLILLYSSYMAFLYFFQGSYKLCKPFLHDTYTYCKKNLQKILSIYTLRYPKKDKKRNLDYYRSIWVEEEELGKDKVIIHKGKQIKFRIPPNLKSEQTLRFKNLGETNVSEWGDLFLSIQLNRGKDVETCLWLSASSASYGTNKRLAVMQKVIRISIPKNSHDGQILRLKELGKTLNIRGNEPSLDGKRGDLLVKLRTFPDNIKPRYQSFGSLDTDTMALEGWVYRKIDEINFKMGKSTFKKSPIKTDAIADMFNEYGWKAIFTYLINHLDLRDLHITLDTSDSNFVPGNCLITSFQGDTGISYNYKILINEKFIDDPFCVTAILAHELCHVVYNSNFGHMALDRSGNDKQRLEEERMVDLLTFMFKLGEFQLRVSGSKHITMGYFNQETFDRMYVITSKKCN